MRDTPSEWRDRDMEVFFVRFPVFRWWHLFRRRNWGRIKYPDVRVTHLYRRRVVKYNLGFFFIRINKAVRVDKTA